MPLQNSIIIDNFYENPVEVREFALKQKFKACHLPRYHTKSFANLKLYNKIQNIIYPFAGKISGFYIPEHDAAAGSHNNKLFRGDSYNGAFICGLGKLVPWVHKDTKSDRFKVDDDEEAFIPEHKHWAGVLYLSPNPPKNSGTSIITCNTVSNIGDIDRDGILSKDLTKWDKVDLFGNVFNRLILYRANQYHTCDNNFGTDMDNCRLTQLFFFVTEH
jgi:hypothetical protein